MKRPIKFSSLGDFPGGSVLKGSDPGGGTKIPQAAEQLSPRTTRKDSVCCK